MNEPGILGLFLASGLVVGFAFQRSRLCFVSCLRDLFLFQATWMTRAILVLLGLTSALGAAAAYLTQRPISELPGPPPLQLGLGGLAFGIGMVLAGSCIAGALWRLGEGQQSQLWIMAGLVAGGWGYRFLPGVTETGGTPLTLPIWLSPLLLGFGLVGLVLWEKSWRLEGEEVPPPQPVTLRSPWSLERGAVVIAVSLAAFIALTGMTWRVASLFFTVDAGAALFAVGLLFGGHGGARFGREWRPRPAGTWSQKVLRLTGGVLMGLGARLGWGCTIGALLGGFSTSTVQPWLWLAGAVVGAWAGSAVLKRIMNRMIQV